jgi:DNA-binding NtrC family response regulator
MERKKILIVEDDKMLCTIFEMFLKEIGHEITSISRTGTDAIESCSENPADVVLMDIHLAGEIDGIEAARQIGEKYDIPVVYITGDTDRLTIEKSVLENTYGYMLKPLYKKNLEITLEFAYLKHQFTKSQREK